MGGNISSELDLDDLRRILADCPEYKRGHHLGRPFMSAYQIAIQFAIDHPNHPLVQKLDVGGRGRGPAPSLARRIARFLSGEIKRGKAPDIEGAFISHVHIGDLWFEHGGREVRPSGSVAHSIFRWAPPPTT